jgi:hypothetical protein
MPVYKYYFSLKFGTKPKPFNFLKNLFQLFQVEGVDDVIANFLVRFDKEKDEKDQDYKNRLISEEILLFQNSEIKIRAGQKMNDEQEKVAEYVTCHLTLSFSNDETISMHWANSSSELALTTEQFYIHTFKEKSPEEIFKLCDKFLQLYEAEDFSFNIESNLNYILEYAHKNNQQNLAKEIKENSKIINKWDYNGNVWLISKINDYDGVFWTDKKILWTHSPVDKLNYQIWNKYTFSKLKQSEYADTIDLEEFPK